VRCVWEAPVEQTYDLRIAELDKKNDRAAVRPIKATRAA